jgi:hypothetical protein
MSTSAPPPPPPPTLDPLVATTLDTLTARSRPRAGSDASTASSTSLDALLSDPNDPISAAHRAARLSQLAAELARSRALHTAGHGSVATTRDEKALMAGVADAARAVVHFAKDDFARCAVMDGHLRALAAAHWEVRFWRVEVGDAPFLCARLAVRVLPCVLAFVDGKVVERVVGFEGLGGTEAGFRTGALERRLLASGVLERAKVGDGDGKVAEERVDEREADVGDDWD